MADDLVVRYNDKVKLKDGGQGSVKFIGEVVGKDGILYGIDLVKGDGKTKGKVKGVEYFKTRGGKKSGRFVKKSAIKSSKKTDHSVAFTVGDGVKVKSKGNGIVRYVGIPVFSKVPKPMFGVALDAAKGIHNGTFKNITYFGCTVGHGMYVEQNKVSAGTSSQTFDPDNLAASGGGAAASDAVADKPKKKKKKDKKKAKAKDKDNDDAKTADKPKKKKKKDKKKDKKKKNKKDKNKADDDDDDDYSSLMSKPVDVADDPPPDDGDGDADADADADKGSDDDPPPDDVGDDNPDDGDDGDDGDGGDADADVDDDNGDNDADGGDNVDVNVDADADADVGDKKDDGDNKEDLTKIGDITEDLVPKYLQEHYEKDDAFLITPHDIAKKMMESQGVQEAQFQFHLNYLGKITYWIVKHITDAFGNDIQVDDKGYKLRLL